MVGRDLGEALTDRPVGPSGELVLRLDQVQLRADSRPFDLKIRAGEIIAVTGALGSGKSNLLGALFGLRPFVSGRATLEGADWRPSGPAEAIAGGVFSPVKTDGGVHSCHRIPRAATLQGPSLCPTGANGSRAG
jgi:simple sugar transport system ATP-binding protein